MYLGVIQCSVSLERGEGEVERGEGEEGGGYFASDSDASQHLNFWVQIPQESK